MMRESVIEKAQNDSCYTREETGLSAEVQNRFVSFGPAGAVITAILASLCCVGPLILVMLGVSSAWIGSVRSFEPYRPLFILFTIGFLIVGFYSVYKRPAGGCESGSICAVPHEKRVGKIVLWTATVIVVFLLILPYLIGLLV